MKAAKQYFQSKSLIDWSLTCLNTHTQQHIRSVCVCVCGCCMETILPGGAWCRLHGAMLTGVTALALRGKRGRRRRRLTTLIGQYLSPAALWEMSCCRSYWWKDGADRPWRTALGGMPCLSHLGSLSLNLPPLFTRPCKSPGGFLSW